MYRTRETRFLLVLIIDLFIRLLRIVCVKAFKIHEIGSMLLIRVQTVVIKLVRRFAEGG